MNAKRLFLVLLPGLVVGCENAAVPGPSVCADECTVEAKECSNGALRICSADADGCLRWGAATACEDGFCADAETCGVCVNPCPSLGATECASGELRVCGSDSNGCSIWGAPDP